MSDASGATEQRTSLPGDWVHETQPMAQEEGHAHVSREWFSQTESFEEAKSGLAQNAANAEQRDVWLGDLQPTTEQGRFGFQLPDGRFVEPDDWCLQQFGDLLGIGHSYPLKLACYAHEGDAEALHFAMHHGWRHSDPKQSLRIRIDQDAWLRGIVPVGVIRTEWLLEVIEDLVPEGRISHRAGDEFTFWGNCLVPDSLRRESDSYYGAMVSITNCELGKQPLALRPSLYRAICRNGCIWGQKFGREIRRGKRADLVELQRTIKQRLTVQLDVVETAMGEFLQTRSLTTDVSMKPVFAATAHQLKLTKEQATAVLDAWHIEKRETPELAQSLFAVINSLTRAGQNFDEKTWVKFDELGGRLMRFREPDWVSLINQAKSLSLDKVEKSFALVA